jgi:hypothetical protein
LKPAWANSSGDPISKNNKSKTDWRGGLSGRGPLCKHQSLEFKPQFHQKRKRKKRTPKSVSFLMNSVDIYHIRN